MRSVVTCAAWLACVALVLPGCLPEPRTEDQLAAELAEAGGSGGADTGSSSGGTSSGGTSSGGGSEVCSKDDIAAVSKDFQGPLHLVGTCLTQEWVPGCTPTAACVGSCFTEQGTSDTCKGCMQAILGPCVEKNCKTPCGVSAPSSVCQNCLVKHCGPFTQKCTP